MKFYTHKTTSISLVDAKFHKNASFCLLDFQFFQTAVTNLSHQYCQPFVQSMVTSSPSSRSVSQPTVPVRRLRYCQVKHLTSPAHWIGHRTVQISIRWTMRFGTFCRNESTAARSATSTIWKNGWLNSGVVLIGTLLTEQWISHVRCDRLHKCVRTKGGHIEHLIWTFWLFWLTSTALVTHDLWVTLFKNSYFSKIKADFYETMQ